MSVTELDKLVKDSRSSILLSSEAHKRADVKVEEEIVVRNAAMIWKARKLIYRPKICLFIAATIYQCKF